MRLEHLLSGDVRPSVRHTLLYKYDEDLVETEDTGRDVRKEQERKKEAAAGMPDSIYYIMYSVFIVSLFGKTVRQEAWEKESKP